MGLSKLPNKETTEDLLKLLETNDVTDKIKKDPSIPTFLTLLNIVPGKDLVRQKYLFNLYKKWIKTTITSNKFTMDMSKYLDYNDIKKHRHFLINLKALNLTIKTKQNLIKQDKTKIKNYTTHFDKFINYYDIKAGNFWLEDYILYYLYDSWTYKNNKRNPLGRMQFANFCNLYFKIKQKSVKHVKYYGVEKTILHKLTPEHLEQIKKGYHERKTHKRKDKKES